MGDVRGNFLGPPQGTTQAEETTNKHIVFLFYFSKPKAGLISSGVAILASIIYSGVVAKVNQIDLPLVVGPAKP